MKFFGEFIQREYLIKIFEILLRSTSNFCYIMTSCSSLPNPNQGKVPVTKYDKMKRRDSMSSFFKYFYNTFYSKNEKQ